MENMDQCPTKVHELLIRNAKPTKNGESLLLASSAATTLRPKARLIPTLAIKQRIKVDCCVKKLKK
jgi:hypothetical protein